MIIANMATYPARENTLPQVVSSIAGQVDVLRVVLNEFTSEPEGEYPSNVEFVFPPEDYKDLGKFYPEIPEGTSFVFLLDDDLLYPNDYVTKSIARVNQYGGQAIFGYHASNYLPVKLSLNPKSWLGVIACALFQGNLRKWRTVFSFDDALAQPVLVDQLGTGTVMFEPQYMPPFEVMKGSSKFVDVRLSKWANERGIPMVALPRTNKWIDGLEFDENIFKTFTRRTPDHVLKEIRSFAGNARSR